MRTCHDASFARISLTRDLSNSDVSGEAGCDGDAFTWSDGTENEWSKWADGEPNVRTIFSRFGANDPSQQASLLQDWSGGVSHCDDAIDQSRSCTGRISCDFAGHEQW